MYLRPQAILESQGVITMFSACTAFCQEFYPGSSPDSLTGFWVSRTHGSAAAHIQEAAADAGPELLETWLILEYCDQGSFDHAIRTGKFNKDLVRPRKLACEFSYSEHTSPQLFCSPSEQSTVTRTALTTPSGPESSTKTWCGSASLHASFLVANTHQLYRSALLVNGVL